MSDKNREKLFVGFAVALTRTEKTLLFSFYRSLFTFRLFQIQLNYVINFSVAKNARMSDSA